MKSIFIVLAACALAANALDTSNFTCIGNPYFTAPYNPNPISPGTTNQTLLDQWNVTYNSSTGIYNLSSYTGLTFCQQLLTTGSCCAPDFLNQSVQAYVQLFNATNNATLKIFSKRVSKLGSYGKVFGKIFGTLINLLSRGHEVVFKLLKNLDKILSDSSTLQKVMSMLTDTNSTEILNSLSAGNLTDVAVDPAQLLNVTYQLVTIVADKAGIGKGEIANFFGSIKALEMVFGTLPKNLFASFQAFPTVDSALVSDALDRWGVILAELGNRTTNVTISITSGKTPKKLRMLGDSNSVSTQSLSLKFPLVLDARNIEAITKSLRNAVKDAKNATELFTILLLNASTIYKTINDTWVSNIENLDDFKFGGSWGSLKEFVTKIGSFIFKDSLEKVVTAAENKKKCIKVVFKYQGYLGCLACDASAMALGKLKLNSTAKTFSPVLSRDFGAYVKGNCSDYVKDLIYMNSFLQALKALKNVNDIDAIARQNPDKVDKDVGKKGPSVNASMIDAQLDIPCSLEDPKCTWIQDNVLDNLGPTAGLLCDYSSEDCDDEEALKSLRAPWIKKSADRKKRMLEDSESTSGSVTYSSETSDEVSTTEVGFSTEPNYIVDSNATANITIDSTPDDDSSSTGTTNSSTGNSTKFALRSLISIPLVVGVIIAFLL